MNQSGFNRNMRLRETIEVIIVLLVAAVILLIAERYPTVPRSWLIWAIVASAFAKTVYYFAESLGHLIQAAACDLPYHRFLAVMGYNMMEVTLSFAVDFYCLQILDPEGFTGISEGMTGAALFFDCFYFSVLNFSFFGYGNIMPMHVSSKIVMLLEVITAFTTVIFLISDFVSMKDSMRKSREREG